MAILLVVGALVGIVAALSLPATTWSEELPEGLPRLEAHRVVLKRPIEALQKVIQQAEHVANSPEKKGSTVSFTGGFYYIEVAFGNDVGSVHPD